MKGINSVVVCALALIINNAAASPVQASSICASEGSDGLLLAHEQCNKYFMCNGGKAEVYACQLNLLFNDEKKYCDWPENVDCRRIPEIPETPEVDETEINNGNDDPSKAPEICAEEGSDGILIAHEDCSKYYQCIQGLPIAYSCPANLVYNPRKNYCDWPANYDCQSRVPVPEVPEVPKVPEVDETENNNGGGNNDANGALEICAQEGSDGRLVAHEDCDKFYKCSEGRPATIECPHNLYYNAEKEYCDWKENVNCDIRNPPIVPENPEPETDVDENPNHNGGGNNDPSKAVEICAEEGSDGILIAHEDCTKYYQCYLGVPMVYSCPMNLVYNPVKNYCDWPENYDCQARLPEVPGEPDVPETDNGGNNDNNASEICAEENSNDRLVAHEECNKFYKCYDGLPVTYICPDNLLYNPNGWCDWPENVRC